MRNIENIESFYFIGIGGIGMSALARYFRLRGKQVFGYDKTPTNLTKTLIREGISIQFDEEIYKIPRQSTNTNTANPYKIKTFYVFDISHSKKLSFLIIFQSPPRYLL